ncbi:hypothetical protein HDK64DRAFT_305019 [Phyllosticta capitalensis]
MGAVLTRPAFLGGRCQVDDTPKYATPHYNIYNEKHTHGAAIPVRPFRVALDIPFPPRVPVPMPLHPLRPYAAWAPGAIPVPAPVSVSIPEPTEPAALTRMRFLMHPIGDPGSRIGIHIRITNSLHPYNQHTTTNTDTKTTTMPNPPNPPQQPVDGLAYLRRVLNEGRGTLDRLRENDGKEAEARAELHRRPEAIETTRRLQTEMAIRELTAIGRQRIKERSASADDSGTEMTDTADEDNNQQGGVKRGGNDEKKPENSA